MKSILSRGLLAVIGGLFLATCASSFTINIPTKLLNMQKGRNLDPRRARNHLVTRKGADGQETVHLVLSAIVTDPARNHSVVQCWELDHPVEVSNEPGLQGTKTFRFPASSENSRYTFIEKAFVGTAHNAPIEQFVAHVAGSARVYAPNVELTPETEGWIESGEDGLLIAGDTTGPGHVTEYSSDRPSVTFQVPIQGGIAGLGGHIVRHSGACTGDDNL